jgi:EmrB/QacA subfamily drug resistance transporter
MAEKKKGFERHEWLVLITLMIASFLGRLDGTIVNLALPKIISAFQITVSQASWISTAYIIANAIFVPVFGKLGDLIGRKKLYLFGIIGFTVTSVLTGLSFNFQSMVIFRVLQAITVSIDYPIALSILARTFEDRGRRAQAMGLWSAIFAVAQVFGPLIGGPLIDNFSWRSVFYINLPLGLLGTLMAMRYIQEPVKEVRGLKNFDIAGSLYLGVALGVLVLFLDQGQTWGWSSLNSLISVSVVLISGFLFIRTENRAKEPVVDLKFFKNETFTASIITSFITFMGMIGGMFLIPLFIQNYLGYSVTKTGLLFIPMAMGMMISAQMGARLSSKIQPRYLISFGMIWAAVVMYSFTSIDVRWTGTDVAFRMFFMTLGLGLGMAPLTNAATSTVPVEEIGVASSVLALARNISGAFGVAIFATILSNSTVNHLINLQRYSIVNTADPNMVSQIYALMVVKANILSFATVFRWTAVFMIIGGISAMFVKESKKDFEIKKEISEPMEY